MKKFDLKLRKKNEYPAEVSLVPEKKEDPTVPSLVDVYFTSRGRVYTYLNEKFDLQAGDMVYVTGKLEGELGKVVSVNTHFKVHRADYKIVIAKCNPELHGEYHRLLDKMISFDEAATTPKEFAWWLHPVKVDEDELCAELFDEEEEAEAGHECSQAPKEEDDIVAGEGYELNLMRLESSPEIVPAVLGRAHEYIREGNVVYLRYDNGNCKAFVQGTKWYEVEFSYNAETGMVTGLLCDCPYPGLCKHDLAVLMNFRYLLKKISVEEHPTFTAIDNDYFWHALSLTKKSISL